MRPIEFHPKFRAQQLRGAMLVVAAFSILVSPPTAIAQSPNAYAAQSQGVLSGGAGKPTLVDRPSGNFRSTDSPTVSERQADSRRELTAPFPNYPAEGHREASYAGQTRATRSQNSSVVQASANGPYEPEMSLDSKQTLVAKTPLPPAQQLTTADRKGSGGTLQMLVSIGSSLLIVVGLFLGVAWCYRKTLSSTMAGGLPKEVVHIVGRTPLAPRQQLVLVRFGSKLVLVSMIQGETRTISEIDDPLEVDQIAGLCASTQPGSISESFRSILTQGAST